MRADEVLPDGVKYLLVTLTRRCARRGAARRIFAAHGYNASRRFRPDRLLRLARAHEGAHELLADETVPFGRLAIGADDAARLRCWVSESSLSRACT